MKKMRPFLLLLSLFILSLLFLMNFVNSQGGLGIGLQIADTSGPIINLIEPINNSGNIHGNVTFSYNASDASTVDNCTLIINNKINISDISITKNTRINFRLNNTAIGNYNWSINCTDNLGFAGNSSERAFSVNLMANFNGSTTNISSADIRNLTNFVIEITSNGKINFSENVDLSQGLDLNKYVNISSNRIEINSTALSALNKFATLSLYGLTFTNPRPLRDGSACPSTICTEVSYSGGTFIFTVTEFTVYSSEETPSSGDSGGS